MMNLETNRFEEVHPKVESALEQFAKKMPDMSGYVRHDGSDVPKGYPVFGIGEEFQLKGYRFKVKAIKEDEIIFEPVGSVSVSKIRSVVYTKKGTGSSKKKKKSGSRKKR
jgi:hypothetical protein